MTTRTSRPVQRTTQPRQSNRSASGNLAAAQQLSSLDQRSATTGRAVLVHGEHSAGKTVLAIQKAPKPLLVLDCDNGLDSVIGLDTADQVQIWNPSNGISYSWEDLDGFRNYVKSGDWIMPYKTIVCDNLTAAQKPVIRWSIDQSMARLDPEKRANRDPDVPSQQDWGKIYRVMDEWIRDIRDVKRRGVHVVFTAGTREWLDQDIGVQRIMPDIEGHERNQVATHMDAVGWLEVDDGVRKLHLAPTGAVITKIRLPIDRHHDIPDEIEDPDFIKMMKVVEITGGGVTKATAKKAPARKASAKRVVKR